MLYGINFVAVFVAAILAFIAGGLWYSKKVFGEIWLEESKVIVNTKIGHSILVYSGSFLFMLISATAFFLLTHAHTGFLASLQMALIIGICFVSTSLGINYFFSGRSLKLFLIDSGYHVLEFLIYALVFSVWP